MQIFTHLIARSLSPTPPCLPQGKELDSLGHSNASRNATVALLPSAPTLASGTKGRGVFLFWHCGSRPAGMGWGSERRGKVHPPPPTPCSLRSQCNGLLPDLTLSLTWSSLNAQAILAPPTPSLISLQRPFFQARAPQIPHPSRGGPLSELSGIPASHPTAPMHSAVWST